MDDNKRIVIWTEESMETDERLSGRLIKFMALTDVYGFLTAHALVEMNDGRVWVLDLDLDTIDFRFFIPGGEDDR